MSPVQLLVIATLEGDQGFQRFQMAAWVELKRSPWVGWSSNFYLTFTIAPKSAYSKFLPLSFSLPFPIYLKISFPLALSLHLSPRSPFLFPLCPTFSPLPNYSHFLFLSLYVPLPPLTPISLSLARAGKSILRSTPHFRTLRLSRVSYTTPLKQPTNHANQPVCKLPLCLT